MQNGNEASPSNISAGQDPLVKMLIALEPHDIFWSNFAYLYISTLSRHWYAKRGRGFAEQQSSWSWLVSKMLITLEPHDKLWSNFTCLYILICTKWVSIEAKSQYLKYSKHASTYRLKAICIGHMYVMIGSNNTMITDTVDIYGKCSL